MKRLHDPVLVMEVLEALQVRKYAHLKKPGKFIDATVGLGGHAVEIVKKGGSVLGIDADKDALKIAKKRLKQACPSLLSRKEGFFKLIYGNFKDIDTLAKDAGFTRVNGVIFDLGISSYQLDSVSRGFSFKHRSAPLDMRINKDKQGVTASDLLALLNKSQLTDLFKVVLPINLARKISEQIVQARKFKKFETIGDFLELVEGIVRKKKSGIHEATLPLLALRIAVNSELENLSCGLPKAFGLLQKGGRLVVISFHSGEDKIVKGFFKDLVKKGVAKMVGKKPVVPGGGEIKKNRKARSAKMRTVEKLQ